MARRVMLLAFYAALALSARAQINLPVGYGVPWWTGIFDSGIPSNLIDGWALLSTNVLSGLGGGSATNAIANLNGLGTNLTLYGTTNGTTDTNVFVITGTDYGVLDGTNHWSVGGNGVFTNGCYTNGTVSVGHLPGNPYWYIYEIEFYQDYYCPTSSFPAGPWYPEGSFTFQSGGYYGINLGSALIVTNGFVAIGTNIAGTNLLRVAGNVDSSGPAAGFSINGVPISGLGGSGGIPTMLGSGTNTTIGFTQTNVFWNPIILVGTNAVVTGTNYYVFDYNTNSAPWTNYPSGNYYSGGVLTNYGPFGVWTNSTGGLYEITLQKNPDGSGTPVYDTVTNGGWLACAIGNKPYYAALEPPAGLWAAWQGATNPPRGSATQSTVNIDFFPIILHGQFAPFTHDFIIDGSTLNYSLSHGFGHRPSRVEWSLLCIHPDTGSSCVPSGFLPGDLIPVLSLFNTYSIMAQYANSTNICLTTFYPLVGQECNYTTVGREGGISANFGSFTNFVLHVCYDP
jgi:hypothetical protein